MSAPPLERVGALRVRCYGEAGPRVVVLHGGPAASGSAAPIARGLADRFRVLEPWQRGSGDERLTVARHVDDLRQLLGLRAAGERPAIVGESWGAMLALAFAAEHPELAGPLVLVGCGTFDPVARARLHRTLDERTDSALRGRLGRLAAEVPDPGERLWQWHRLTARLYSFDPVELTELPEEPFDLRAHEESWADMLRLQEEGRYPAAFSAIRGPVLMLHGDHDPHPGEAIRDSLLPCLPQLEYRELARCGHAPWTERLAGEEFFAELRGWLERNPGGPG